MTKRLSAGVLLTAFAVFFTASSAFAANPPTREWRGDEDASSGVPLFFRSAAGTTWINVGQACAPEDTANSTHSPSQVWCFEGAGGANTWPSRGTQGALAGFPNGTDAFGHWSKFDPPVTPASKWFITNRNVGVGGGSRAAWAACDSAGVNTGCTDLAFWIFKEGYGDDWNYSLVLDIPGANQSDTSFVRFDIRYDSECNYDYAYLEYLNDTTGQWVRAQDASGRQAIFNAVSGNLDSGHGGTGRACGTDYFFHSDQFPGTTPYYGNSTWMTGVTFPIPPQVGAAALQLRWRAFSDGAWSDADGSGDTDGLVSIDNVKVTFKAAPADSVRDTFESNPQGLNFNNPSTFGSLTFAQWLPQPIDGQTYDGWHLEFDPKYTNKGNTCTFSNDWMWSAKPASGPIPVSGFSYYLVTPKIYSNGWTGGVMEYSGYMCCPDNLNDYTNTHMRYYNSATGSWSLWNDFDGFITFAGCDFWNMNNTESLTPFLGAEVDSVQMAFEMLDVDAPGDFQWGLHGSVTFLIDNVSVGSFDGSATVFTARNIDIFSDTFSRVDPAHTPQMPNSSEGNWIGNGGTAQLAQGDSLAVQIDDVDGVTASNVRIYWRVGTGTPPTFGSWSNKLMVLSSPNATSATDEGTYRTVIGNTTTEDASANEAGSLGNPAKDPIWNAGQTVEYYVKVTDNGANVAVWPGAADDTPTPVFFRFQILPFNRTVGGGVNVLLVDDYTRADLDFQNSSGFQATGGAGFGNFTSPVNEQSEDMVERALVLMYGGSEDLNNNGIYGAPKWDIYNVQGGGTSAQREPRIISDVAEGLGGVANDVGVPNYEAVIWLNGTFDAYSYADTTRLELQSFLDNGGKLFSTGDDVAYFLGVGGNNADSTIGFLGNYLGVNFPSATDDLTADKVLNVVGSAGTSLAGVTVGLYGECPGIRKTFDKLTLNPTVPGVRVATVLATYQAGDAATNNRPAIIKNVRVVGGGVAVHCGFGIEALVSDMARACLLNRVFVTDFGLPATSFTGCINSGTDAPVVANGRFGFDLAQATPNPFSENTSIRFSVPNRTHVSIEVYNILGQKVRTLVDETLEGNSYVRDWDGRADGGAKVSSGIYFYKMVAGDFAATRKAVMLK